MLKHVLSAIPTHASTCFELPMSLCKRIQSALTRFWWDSADKKKICWIAWSKITLPKIMGDLGIRDIQLFNIALLAKQAWRLVSTPDCLLSRILLGKYWQNRSFLDLPPTPSSSHGWISVLLGRDLLVTNLGKVIGDGNSTIVWQDRWILNGSIGRPFGPPIEMDQDLMVADLLRRGSNEWNVPKVKSLFPLISKKILSISPSTLGANDAFVWTPTKDGVYSTKPGYFVAMKNRAALDNETDSSLELEWTKKDLGITLPPKH